MRLVVLYGSQTGTAQDVAEQIYRKALRWHVDVTLSSLDDFAVQSLCSGHAAIFVCSTTGQGEEPDNMKSFWRLLLQRKLPPNLLLDLEFAVLGLGDSSYPKFNFVAKRLHRRLCQLGATPLIDVALADDQHELGPEGVFNPWLASIWSRIVTIVPPPPNSAPLREDLLLPSKYDVTLHTASPVSRDLSGSTKGVLGSETGRPFFAPVLSNERVTPDSHWQDVRLITFDLSDSEETWSWSPGDIVYVQPSNLAEDVLELCELLDLDLDARIELKARGGEAPLPPPWILDSRGATVRECVEGLWDLRALPRRYFFELLGQVTPLEMERERLCELLDPANQQDLWNYCHRPRRTCLETLRDFPGAAKAIPFAYLFDLFTSIKPRAFSIASSSSWLPGRLQILVAVVEYKTRMQALRKGLCSTFLRRCVAGQSHVPLWTKKGTLKFPEDASGPTIMIGPGTGIAPFRAYLQQLRTKSALSNGDGRGEIRCTQMSVEPPAVIFFGCRNRDKDFFFSPEWEEMEKLGLLRFFAAFSRDQEIKVYVQHKLLEHGDLVWRIVEDSSGYIFLAGNAKQMPKDVCDALKQIFRERGGLDSAQADDYFSKLESSGRFQQETWS